MKMLEKCARALSKQKMMLSWDECHPAYKQMTIDKAKIVMKELLEPDEAMLKAGKEACKDNAYIERKAFVAMIEKAMED